MRGFEIVVPCFNGNGVVDLLLSCIPESIPVTVVDDLSYEPLQVNRSDVRVIRLDKKGYFSGACNRGMAETTEDVLILNHDLEFSDNYWLEMVEKYRKSYGIFGDGVFGHPAWEGGYVQGTWMYISRKVINEIGYFDEKNYPLWGATAEYQLRACRKGFKALPLKGIPGMIHSHRANGRFGPAITERLKREPEKKNLFIRTPPTVSVVTSCYNYGRYMKDLVNSLIGGETSLGYMNGQTMQDFELVIVDDCSDKQDEELIGSYHDPMKAIRVIRSGKRLGTAGGHNLGIKHSFGKAITVIGSDDMMEEERIETLFARWQKDRTKVIYDDITTFKNGERMTVLQMPEYDYCKLRYKNTVHAGIMFSREAWQVAGGYPETMGDGREDWAFNVALGLKNYCGEHIAKPMYLYRREGHNRTLGNTTPKWHNYFYGKIKSLYPEAYGGEGVGCCGSRGKIIDSAGRRLDLPSMPGSDGMVLVEYVGKSVGDMVWYGVVTRSKYISGGVKKKFYADTRDLRTGDPRKPGLLEIVEGKRRVFSLVK